MATTEATVSSLRKSIRSHVSTMGWIKEEDPRKLLDHLKLVLCDEKQYLSRSIIVNAINTFVLLSSEPTGNGAPLFDFLQSQSVKGDFYDYIFSKFLSVAEGNSAVKGKSYLALKHKIQLAKLMKNWSPHVNLQAVYNHLEPNLVNKEHTKLLLSILLHNCTAKEERNTASLRILQLLNNSSVSSSIHRYCISLLCSVEENCHLFEAIDSDAESFEASTRKMCKWLIHTSTHQSQQMSKLMAKKTVGFHRSQEVASMQCS